MKKIMNSTVALPIVVSIIVTIAAALGGYYSARAGVMDAISKIEKLQAALDVKVANIETNFYKHQIDQGEAFREILVEIKASRMDYKELLKGFYELKVQISDP